MRTSRLTAKIDNNCIADGFQLYLHSFIVAKDGEWAVVQQGMNPESGMARRYHWHSAAVKDFVAQPHTGIAGEHQGVIMDLVNAQAKPAQDALLAIARTPTEKNLGEIRHLTMPRHHDVRAKDVDLKRLGAVLSVAYERDLRSFADFVLLENLGPRTVAHERAISKSLDGRTVMDDRPRSQQLDLFKSL